MSAGTGLGFGGGLAQGPNVKQEVDTNEGQNSLAIQLQYQGVLALTGVTAALKLPAGFKAAYPLTDDPHRWDIALSACSEDWLFQVKELCYTSR
jgi:hypothetical protein